MKWKTPPIIKIYEALGAVADGRVEVTDNTAKVFSSSGNKFYIVTYASEQSAIMANDNGSYWKGYLGYPAIAFLLQSGKLEWRPEMSELLKDIAWKDLNTKFKNDFNKTLQYILSNLNPIRKGELESYTIFLAGQLEKMGLSLLGKKALPPEGY